MTETINESWSFVDELEALLPQQKRKNKKEINMRS